MEWTARRPVVGWRLPRRTQLDVRDDPVVTAFITAARAAGLTPSPLAVRELDRAAIRGRIWRVVRLEWAESRLVRLLGWSFSIPRRRRSTFLEFAPGEVSLPAAAQMALTQSRDLPGIKETVVFVEKDRPDPVLAVQLSSQWLELYRWPAPDQVWPEAPVTYG